MLVLKLVNKTYLHHIDQLIDEYNVQIENWTLHANIGIYHKGDEYCTYMNRKRHGILRKRSCVYLKWARQNFHCLEVSTFKNGEEYGKWVRAYTSVEVKKPWNFEDDGFTINNHVYICTDNMVSHLYDHPNGNRGEYIPGSEQYELCTNNEDIKEDIKQTNSIITMSERNKFIGYNILYKKDKIGIIINKFTNINDIVYINMFLVESAQNNVSTENVEKHISEYYDLKKIDLSDLLTLTQN